MLFGVVGLACVLLVVLFNSVVGGHSLCFYWCLCSVLGCVLDDFVVGLVVGFVLCVY